ncbi:MAG TPA: hypothetical protein IAA19_00440 [Candidatus Olsenella pullistercoris]|uniref:Neutral/alkaline non-lysosomal ceramidase N-terminal domain-containing protein n=1 Tax=Candidatus Olsenella pullistercoris TaxID=2838712 RepID=A0A9D2EXY8_9ACTN|nr:hypothetical protein [Candidatus Olsenella pullistercoris]
MRAATALADITPHGTFYMEGYANDVRRQPALGVHDAPCAVLLLLEVGEVRVLFVSLDVCIVSAEGSRLLREGLSSCLGLPEENIVISAIHSHSCPNGFEGEGGIVGVHSHGYVEMASGRVIEAATGLEGALVEVTPELASLHVRGWYSNRNDRERPFDDSVHVLRLRAEDGTVAGAMLNFNCHATVVGPFNRYLTTDVMGGVRARVADWVGCVPYTFTGASADLGNRQFRRGNDFAELERVSCGIASAIMEGAEFAPVELVEPGISSFSRRVSYNNEDYFDQYRAQLADVTAVLDDPETGFDERKLADTERQLLESQLSIHDVDFTIKMRTIDFGGVVFVTFPGELASDLGVRVKEAFGDRVAIVIGYANDYQGYFVPEGDFGGTSYESYVTKMPRGGIERVLDEYEESL